MSLSWFLSKEVEYCPSAHPVIAYHFQSISPRLIISVPTSTATNVITIIAVAKMNKNRDKLLVKLLFNIT